MSFERRKGEESIYNPSVIVVRPYGLGYRHICAKIGVKLDKYGWSMGRSVD